MPESGAMDRYVDPTEQLVIEIFVRDIVKSTAFYRRLGFELLRDDGDFVELTWEGHRLFLDERGEAMGPVPDTVQANVRVMVPDVDRYWDLAAEMGARVLAPIADKSYGLRDFAIADPDGFAVRLATRLEDLGRG